MYNRDSLLNTIIAKGTIVCIIAFLSCRNMCAEEYLRIAEDDERPLAQFFLEECLPRGITNAIGVQKLREWATNELRLVNESIAADNSGVRQDKEAVSLQPYKLVAPEAIASMHFYTPGCIIPRSKILVNPYLRDIPKDQTKIGGFMRDEIEQIISVFQPSTREPKIGHYVDSSNRANAISISWSNYGIVVGGNDYVYDRKPTFQHKLSNGVHLWYSSR